MANQLISLLDLTKRTGSDQAVGIVEETITVAPELNTLMGRPIAGRTYFVTSRTLPTVGFRQANQGSNTVKSTYTQKAQQCYIIDGQVQMDKAIADVDAKTNLDANGGPVGLGNILGDEANAVTAAAFISVGAQFYYGTGTGGDANGFGGLQAFYDTGNMEVSAGGTPGATTSVYIVWENIKGVHFVFGNQMGITLGLPEWRVQQVLDSNSKPYTAYVNNIQGWIGLATHHTRSVARIKLVDSTHAATDKLIAQAISKFPLAMRTGLKIFMNPNAAYYLQNSRSAASTGLTSSNPLAYASLPVESCGVPITLTNSLVDTE